MPRCQFLKRGIIIVRCSLNHMQFGHQGLSLGQRHADMHPKLLRGSTRDAHGGARSDRVHGDQRLMTQRLAGPPHDPAG